MTEAQLKQRRDAAPKGGKALFDKYGSGYMREIGRKGARAFHAKYSVQPVGTNGWAIVGRKDNVIIEIIS